MLDKGKVIFEPSGSGIEVPYTCLHVHVHSVYYLSTQVVILNAFDKMIDVVSSVPRVESQLYPNEVKN